MNDPLYRLDGLRKRRGESFVLEIDRLEVLRGETLCLAGPTGAGKSTLLRLLSLLDKPTTGNIVFDGVSASTAWLQPTLRRIATVPQQPVMLSHTVRYNVEFGLRVRGESSPTAKATRMLELLRLDALAHQSASRLSGGQTQLVALARALVLEPDVLLLDEPTAHLDPAHVALVEDVVEQQRVRTRATIVWVTHNLFQARRRGSRTALLIGGKLVEVANTADFFQHPQDQRTRQFVDGEMIY